MDYNEYMLIEMGEMPPGAMLDDEDELAEYADDLAALDL